MSRSLDQIVNEVTPVFKKSWTRVHKSDVPEVEELSLGNNAGVLEGAVLYADMCGSTSLVKEYKDYFAAEMYKSFLQATCKVIENNGGNITSFDGDRVMAVFVGEKKCSNAAKTALQIKAAIMRINDVITSVYPLTDYRIDFRVGVDVSDLFVVKTGIRGENDLAWIGEAANNAAKFSEIRNLEGPSFISERLFKRLNDDSKYKNSAAKDVVMWQETSIVIQGQKVYESSFWWKF